MQRRLLAALFIWTLLAGLMPAAALAQAGTGAPAWAHEASIYHVFTDRFRDGDPGRNADVDPSLDFSEALRSWMGGDLAGVLEGLDHIEGLGFDTLWLGPVYENAYFHGYHPIDFLEVDDNFGTVADMAALVDEVHARGMRILYDFVPNHTSDQHPFFQDALASCQDSPYYAFYRFNEDCTDYEQYFGIPELPVLDLRAADTPAATYLLEEVVPFYLDELDFDGFRIDHAEGPSVEFFAALREVAKSIDPEVYLLGELLTSRERIAEYQGVLDGSINGALMDAFKSGIAADGDLARIDREVRADLEAFEEGFALTSFLDSHDSQRFVYVAGNDAAAREKLEQAFVTQFTLPHAPIVYYGTEVGMGQTANTPAPDGGWVDRWYREPMPWQDEHTWAHAGTEGWVEQEWHADVAAVVQELNGLRDEHPVLVHGRYRPAGPTQETLAYERFDEDKRLLVLIDRGGARDLSVAGLVDAPIPDGVTLTGLRSGEAHSSAGGDLALPLDERHAEVYEVTGELPVAPPPPDPEDVPPEQVVIAGNLQDELGCEADWDPACTATALEQDPVSGHWEATFTVPAGEWEYKAALDGSWERNFGLDAEPNGPNIPLSLEEETAVTFLFSFETGWATDDVRSRIVTAPGDHQEEVGCEADWDPTCMVSWLQDPDGDGTYTWTTTDIPPGDYEAKAAVGRTWDEEYGAGGEPGGANIPFTVPEGGASVTFRFVSDTDVLTVEVAAIEEPDQVHRLAGSGRIETAIAISQDGFGDGEAEAVVLARADLFPDALAGTPLAVHAGGPLLLTSSGTLLEQVADEIQRVLPDEGTVWLLGGEAALAEEVAAAVEDLGHEARRAGGATRVETSVAVAEALGDPAPLLVATGTDFPDALAAGAAAAAAQGAVLLVAGDRPHPAVTAHLASRPDAERYAVGGPAVRAYPGMLPVSGATREETAVAVAERLVDSPQVVGIARRDDFADALTGGAHVGARGGPVLLTPTGSLHAAVAARLCASADEVDGAYVYGGDAAVGAATADAVAAAISGEGCG